MFKTKVTRGNRYTTVTYFKKSRPLRKVSHSKWARTPVKIRARKTDKPFYPWKHWTQHLQLSAILVLLTILCWQGKYALEAFASSATKDAVMASPLPYILTDVFPEHSLAPKVLGISTALSAKKINGLTYSTPSPTSTPVPTPIPTQQPTPIPVITPAPVYKSPEQVVHEISNQIFGSSQWRFLRELLMHESGFQPSVKNPSSGACGIFQSDGCEKVLNYCGVVKIEFASVECQTRWGLNYIQGRYGTPYKALQWWYERHLVFIKGRWVDAGNWY